MSALPIAKVKVAIRKNSPTRTALFLVGAVVGPVTIARERLCLCPIDPFSVAAVMASPPFCYLRCKYTILTS